MILEVKNISKSYTNVKALDDVSFKTGNSSFVGLISRAKKWLVGEF